MNNAVYADGNDDWISLGDVSYVSCIANTSKCPTDGFRGISVVFWLRLHRCSDLGGILSSYGSEYGHGFGLLCSRNSNRIT